MLITMCLWVRSNQKMSNNLERTGITNKRKNYEEATFFISILNLSLTAFDQGTWIYDKYEQTPYVDVYEFRIHLASKKCRPALYIRVIV